MAKDRSPLGEFLHWPALVPFLYIVSAALLLWGIGQVVIPAYHQTPPSNEKYLALVSINFYEVALLVVTLLTVLWRRVHEDATALIVLMAVFLVGSATVIDPATRGVPWLALLFGCGGLALAAGKLLILARTTIGRLTPATAGGVGVLLAWNFLMPAVLSLALVHGALDPQLVALWLCGWLATLIGAATLVYAALRLQRSAPSDLVAAPFLRSSPMRMIFAGIVLVATLGHQYALVWDFALPLRAGDLLPGVCLLAIYAVVLQHVYRSPYPALQTATLAIPLPIAAAIAVGGFYSSSMTTGTAWLNDPAVNILIMALACGALGRHWRRDSYFVLAGCAVTFSVWAIGAGTLTHFDPNWGSALITAGLGLAAASAIRRNENIASTAALVLAIGFTWVEPIAIRLEALQITSPAAFAVLVGALTMLAVCLLRAKFAAWVTFAAAVVLAGGILHIMADRAPLMQVLCGLVILGYVMPVAVWVKHPWAMLPGAGPLTVAMWICLEPSPRWLLVVAGFATLATGAVISLFRRSTLAVHEASG